MWNTLTGCRGFPLTLDGGGGGGGGGRERGGGEGELEEEKSGGGGGGSSSETNRKQRRALVHLRGPCAQPSCGGLLSAARTRTHNSGLNFQLGFFFSKHTAERLKVSPRLFVLSLCD